MHVLKEGAHSMAKEIAYDNETREKLATGVAKLADAFVTLPGGLGTFDEFFVVLSQVKAGELDAKSAILNVGGYFDPLVEMLDRATATGLNSTDWRSNCDVFDAPEPLAAWLEA